MPSCPSTSSEAFYITCNSCETRLVTPIDLSGYEVSVVDCYIPPEVVLYGSRYYITVIYADVNENIKRITSNLRASKRVTDFLKSLYAALGEYASVDVSDQGILRVACADGVTLIFSKGLSSILGLKESVNNGEFSGHLPIQLRQVTDYIAINTNIVEPYYFNGQYKSCIYQGALVNSNSGSKRYRAIGSHFHTLKLEFCNLQNEFIDIPDGTFSVNFHFKKMS